PRHGYVNNTQNYNYSAGTLRQLPPSAGGQAMQIEVLTGLPGGSFVEAECRHFASCPTVQSVFSTFVGLNGTAVLFVGGWGSYGRTEDVNGAFPADWHWRGYPAIGRNIFTWLESGVAGPVLTFYAQTTNFANGLFIKADM